MILPPLLIQVSWRDRWPHGMWLPVGLLWPVAFLLLLLLSPLIVLGAVACVAAGLRPPPLASIAAGYRLLCETRGIRIDVVSWRSRVTVAIY